MKQNRKNKRKAKKKIAPPNVEKRCVRQSSLGTPFDAASWTFWHSNIGRRGRE